MSINIYAAHLRGRNIVWADDNACINLANGNFYPLWDHLGLKYLNGHCGHLKVKHMRMVLQTTDKTRYHGPLNQLCAQAEILKAPYIAFA